ncbi:EAL domain-containing protein [Rhodoferax sp.]|uniref:EAL domain-containing protein n=1 Tax=Rhodoferax sp. TaxID=50421 RepID=UPI00276EFFA6|nr:EAL domain-containing protein [Rhodoferax sp.]
MTPSSGFESKVLAAFFAAMVVVAGLAGATWKMANDVAAADRWVAHTYEVLDSLMRTRADTLQVELSTQNFRLTGDPSRLTERDAAIATREARLSRIQQLTRDNPRQQERWAQLREVIDQRLAISRRVEALRKTQGTEAANAFVATAPLAETRARTYRLLGEMDDAERRLLANRQAGQSWSNQLLVVAGALVALLLVALLAATYVLIRRQLRETETGRRALAASEESLATTLQSIGDAVLATDTAGRVTRMNRVAERLTGWSLDEARGRPVDEVFCIVNEQTRAPAEVPVAKVLATGEIQGLVNHTALIARNGGECPIADSAAPIRDVKGRVDGVVLVFRDVTLERQHQLAVRQHNELLEQRVQERTLQLRESEDHLLSVINNVPALLAYVDAQQRYVYVNHAYRQRFAPGLVDITGLPVQQILGEARYAQAAPLVARVMRGESQRCDWQPFAGVWQAIHYVPKRDASNEVVGYYVLGTDITERKLSEEEIKTLNATLEQRVDELQNVSRALKTLSAGNRTMLRATHEQELLDNMCRVVVEVGGYQMASVWYRAHGAFNSSRPMAEHGHPGGLAALQAMQGSLADNARGRDISSDPGDAPWRGALPGHFGVLAFALRAGGETIGSLVIHAAEPSTFGVDAFALLSESADDLSFGIATLRARVEQREVQAAMLRLTRYDTLTGLPNETQFTELLTAEIDRGKQQSRPFAVLQTNIERLSEINDALGFSHGDEMLRQFGARLSAAVPASAIVARLRGDEFAILLPDSDRPAAIGMVRSLEQALAEPFPIADIPLDVLAKTGVALFPEHGSTPHDLYRHVDIALKQAKKKGVGHAIFDPTQSQDRSHRLNMAGALRRAIEGGDLLLYLQPKVQFATGRVCGAEGLARWKHAERGLIAPGEFIELAEQTGLIKPLTEWAIETGLRLNQTWAREGRTLPIAINLSARNLRDEDLLKQIRSMQARWGVAPGLLELEITESAVMEDAEFALRVLHHLHDDGIPLHIDDFGTGYSSLSYLQKLPVDYIKIDQSFVRDMSTCKDSAVIVRSTIDLVHDLGRKTVAEGVETQQDWSLLAEMGCDVAQGYFIARPMPSDELQDWIESFHGSGRCALTPSDR